MERQDKGTEVRKGVRLSGSGIHGPDGLIECSQEVTDFLYRTPSSSLYRICLFFKQTNRVLH